jgi:transposase
LNRTLWSLVRTLSAQVTILQAKVLDLEARLAQNSRNSSKPPSSDGLSKPKPKPLRKRGERPTGGQKGHKGHALEKVANADRIVQHAPPAQCNACQRLLPESS